MFKVTTIFWASLLAMTSMGLSAQDNSQVAALVEQLKTPERTDQAAANLLEQAKADPEARKFLAANLPLMIEKGPITSQSWRNAVKLAGELKIEETAPALAKWIGESTGSNATTLAQGLRLDHDLAGKALAQIGDPSIPVLNDVLKHGSIAQRWAAVGALNIIASPAAKESLRQQINHETDPGLRDFMLSIMKKWR